MLTRALCGARERLFAAACGRGVALSPHVPARSTAASLPGLHSRPRGLLASLEIPEFDEPLGVLGGRCRVTTSAQAGLELELAKGSP